MIVAAIIIVVGPAGFLAGGWFIRAIEDGRLSLAPIRAALTPRRATGPKRLKFANFV